MKSKDLRSANILFIKQIINITPLVTSDSREIKQNAHDECVNYINDQLVK